MANSIKLPSRGWLIAGGILSILAGMVAIGFPLPSSIAITKMIGAIALVTGLFELIPGIFSRNVAHRWLTILSGIFRVIVGIYILVFPIVATTVLALFLAVLFLIEGIFSIIASFKLKPMRGWVWVLVNGIAALVLGAMIYARWPMDSFYVIGLLFGINCIFVGVALLALDPEVMGGGGQEQAPAQPVQ
jgi:uncharacterized membrane protein HdeD (DUF308 family)